MKIRSLKLNGILNVIRQTCNIAFPLILIPYVSRVLGNDNYGKYSFAYSVVAYFVLAAMLGIDTYAIREGSKIRDDRNKEIKFASEITTLNLVSCLASYILLILITFIVPRFSKISDFILILSILLPCNLLGREWINTVYEDFLYITVRYVLVEITGLLLVFLFVRNRDDLLAYTWIQTFMYSGGLILNIGYTQKRIPIKFTNIKNVKRHLRPVFVLFGSQIAISIYIQSDITMLGLLASTKDVGIYSIASKIYSVSKSVINALTVVAIPRIVYYRGNDEQMKYNETVSNLFSYLLLLVTPFSIGLFFLRKEALLVMGGPEYLAGSAPLGILSFAMLIAVFSGFFANAILITNNKENEYLKTTSVAAVLNILLNLIFIPHCGIVGASITTLIAEGVVLLLSIYYGKGLYKIYIRKKDIPSYILGNIFVSGCCFMIYKFIGNLVFRILLSILISVIGYFTIMVIFNNSIVKNEAHKLRNRICKR